MSVEILLLSSWPYGCWGHRSTEGLKAGGGMGKKHDINDDEIWRLLSIALQSI